MYLTLPQIVNFKAEVIIFRPRYYSRNSFALELEPHRLPSAIQDYMTDLAFLYWLCRLAGVPNGRGCRASYRPNSIKYRHRRFFTGTAHKVSDMVYDFLHIERNKGFSVGFYVWIPDRVGDDMKPVTPVN